MDRENIKQLIFPVAILMIGLIITTLFVVIPNDAKKRPKPEDKGFLVEIGQVQKADYKIQVEAMGQVAPSMQINLKSYVTGEVLNAAEEFIPGGFFESGAPILYIDPEDYNLELQKQQAMLNQAGADLKLEMGRQSIAKNEMAILEKNTGKKPDNPALALREPQLEQARAEVSKARAAVEAAKLNLERTTIYAPFNALIINRNTTLGDKISQQSPLATLVNTDEYWIKISVPVHSLKWLDIPKTSGYTLNFARVIMDEGRGEREGYLLKMTGTLDSQSRLADMLVAIPDPLLLEKKDGEQGGVPLILGDYVKVIIEGRTLSNAVRLPLNLVRDGDIVWVIKDERLYFRKVDMAYEDRSYAYITSGLEDGDVIVTSDVPVPVDGMKVRVMDSSKTSPLPHAGGGILPAY